MRIKSYFTDSVQEAIEHARVELGAEAMLMNSKKTEPELRALGAYEVVFGVTSEVASASSTVLPKKTAAAPEMLMPDRRRPVNGSGGISKGLAALLAVTQSSPGPPSELSSSALAASAGVLYLHDTQGLGDTQSVAVAAAQIAGEAAQASPLRSRAAGNLMPPSNLPQNGVSQSGDLSRELADLREQIEAVKRSMQQHAQDPAVSGGGRGQGEAGAFAHAHSSDPEPAMGAAAAWPASEARAVEQQLTAGGFSPALAGEIGAAVALLLPAERHDGSAALREAALYAELSRRFRVAPGLGTETEAGTLERAVLFTGPAGSGKTTSLLKLALRHSLGGRGPLQILTLDTLRVGGWEQLAAYSRIAGLAFNVIHNPAGLGQALAEYRGKKLVLIDTPGFSAADWRETPELAGWVAREMARDSMLEVQLVLSAAMRPAIARRALEQFGALRPGKLLLTHLDEVEAPGVALELAIRSGLPLSYLSHGQQIPEDLEEASLERLIEPFAAAVAPSSRVTAAA